MKNNLENKLKDFIGDLKGEISNLTSNSYRSEEYRYVKIKTLGEVVDWLEYLVAMEDCMKFQEEDGE